MPPAGRVEPSGCIVSMLTRAWMAMPRGAGHVAWSRPSSASVRPAGQLQLRRDEVEAGDLLGHRVLDLQAGVGLDEHVPASSPVASASTRNSNVPRLS